MKHKPNPLKDRSLVLNKVIKRVQRLENRLNFNPPKYDMDGTLFHHNFKPNSKDSRIQRRLDDITNLTRFFFLFT
ncbi:MAG: hypothetical protein ACXW2E_00750 [Nitrososphaeraceae archaeon]